MLDAVGRGKNTLVKLEGKVRKKMESLWRLYTAACQKVQAMREAANHQELLETMKVSK